MDFSVVIIALLLFLLSFPWILSLVLRLFFGKYVKNISCCGYFSFKNIEIQIGLNKVHIQQIKIIFTKGKIILKIQDIQIDIVSIVSNNSQRIQSRMSAIKMLSLRLFVSIFSCLIIPEIENIIINLENQQFQTKKIVLNIELEEETGALNVNIYISKIFIKIPGINLKVSLFYLNFYLPGQISFIKSFEDSKISISIGSLSGKISSIPEIPNDSNSSNNNSNKSELSPPKNITLIVHKAKLALLKLEIITYSIEFRLNPLRLSILLITSTNADKPSIHIPCLCITEDASNCIQISTKYVGIIVEQVIPTILTLIKSVKQPRRNNKPKKNLSIDINQIEAIIEKSNDVKLSVKGLKVLIGVINEIITDCISINKNLEVYKFTSAISDNAEFAFASAKIDLNEDLIKDVINCIADIYHLVPPKNSSPPEPSEPKLVKLNFSDIEAHGSYPDGFKILITVEKFTASILPRCFDLYFYNSKIYDTETIKLHIISTTVCKVHKEYKNKIAQIDVLGDEIEIKLPRQYYLARSVIKFLKGSHKVYKWCRFAILQVNRITTYVPETAELELIFKNFLFTADDKILDTVNLKKNSINCNGDVYLQLKNMLVYPLITLSCKRADVKLNNFQLDNIVKIKNAMGKLDNYDIPNNEFFAVMLAYDFTCVGKSVIINIRDFPYEFCCIKALRFGGRSILSKNRMVLPAWAQFKHHFDMSTTCEEVSTVFGIGMIKTLMDLLYIVRRLFFFRSSQPTNIEKLDLIDFLRYFLHGKMQITVNTCKNIILSNASPYIVEGFNLDINECIINIITGITSSDADQPNDIELVCLNTIFYHQNPKPILNIPMIKLLISNDILCQDSNHWIILQSVNMFDEFRNYEINTNASVSISNIESMHCIVFYQHLETSPLLALISLLANPPVTIIPHREKSPAKFFKNVKSVKLTHLKLSILEFILITETGQGACLNMNSLHLTAQCELQSNVLLMPWEIKSAAGTCCEINVYEYHEDCDFNTLLKCASIEYSYNTSTNHFLSVEGFRVCINFYLIALVTEMAISRPEQVKSLFKRNRDKKKWKAKSQKTTSRIFIRGIIIKPEVELANEESECRLITIGGVGEFEVIEENLIYDIYHKDLKRKAKFSMKSIECFIDDSLDEIRSLEQSSKIIESKNIEIALTYFSYPFCYFDYAHNCEAADINLWYKEKRINKLEIDLPLVSSIIESEDFWTLIDVIKGFVGFIPNKTVSISDRLMEDEFKRYGGKELVKVFNENSVKTNLSRSGESQILRISLQSLGLSLRKSGVPIIELLASGIKGNITTFTDMSCQKGFEIHKITLNHGNTIMITPLLFGSEEYLPSNIMLTLRILDRWLKGKETLWPVLDHLEFLVFPLKINFSKEIYKDLYSFFFNEDKAKTKGKHKVIKLPRLYKYIHLNEIKICITVTGWIGLTDSKISIKPFTRQNKFKTLQGIFDKIMKHGLKNIISQVPSICIQSIGIKKKNFIPTTEPAPRSKSFLDKLKKKRDPEKLSDHELQKIEGLKLMFGKNFK